MKTNPLPGYVLAQALADGGQWLPPAQDAQDYGWMDQLPRGMEFAPRGQVINPGPGWGLTDTPWNDPPPRLWSDIPPWLEALNQDQEYLRGRVIDSPYGGWGGSYMQSRRRGQR